MTVFYYSSATHIHGSVDDFGFYYSASLLLGWAAKHNRFSLVPRSSSRHGGSRRRNGCVEEKRMVGGRYTWWHACGDGRVGNPLSRGPRFDGVGHTRRDTACYGFGPLGVVEFKKEKHLDFSFESATWLVYPENGLSAEGQIVRVAN